MDRKIYTGIQFVVIALLAALAGVAAASAGAVPGRISAAVTSAPGKGNVPMLAAGSGFTYQGRLTDGSGPANGQYDLVFTLFDAASAGTQVGSPVTMTNQVVSGGLFNVMLDFGPGAFSGDARWLEVSVRPSGTGSFATLTPRQQLTASPYALGLAPGAGVTGTLAGPMLTLSNTMGAGLYAQSTSNNGVTGIASSPATSGVYGENFSTGYGIAGRNNSTNILTAALYGQNIVTGTGVFGRGGAYGVIGYADRLNGTGVYGEASGPNSAGLSGYSSSGSGVIGDAGSGPGVKGNSNSGPGVSGISSTGYGISATSSINTAVYGTTSTTLASNIGAIYGLNNGSGPGVRGNSSAGQGVRGETIIGYGLYGNSTGNGFGVYGAASGASAGVFGTNTGSGNGVYGTSASNHGVYGTTNNVLYSGVYGTNTSGHGYGVYAKGGTIDGIGVYGAAGGTAGYFTSTNGIGVYGTTQNVFNAGVNGSNTSGRGYGVYGSGGTIDGVGVYGTAGGLGGQFIATAGTGVYGIGTGNGIEGHSTNGIASGVYGDNFSGGFGVAARASVTGTALFADNLNALAGNFRGNVSVQGSLSKGGGSFKIDHPLDPTNKYLYHSFVESPDMMNIYNGNVTLDANGEATVTMPGWFEALNQEYRYQLTTIGGFAPVYVAQEMQGNSFRIAGGKSGMKVSWQVTGIRHDPWAEEHRIPVEENKSTQDKGKYLYPDAYGKPETMAIGYEQSQQLAQSQAKPQQEHGR